MNNSRTLGRVLVLIGSFLLLLGVIAACNLGDPVEITPDPQINLPCNGTVTSPCYLSRKVLSNAEETNLYYDTVDPQKDRTTLSAWWAVNDFWTNGKGDVRAIYYNAGDLNIGRDMNCKTSSTGIACYVSNYGPPPAKAGTTDFPNATKALLDAINHANGDPVTPFATVAMEYHPGEEINEVTFYLFKDDGTRDNAAALDGEGRKSVPQMCMACHGGKYDSATHSITNASFLPFDIASFQFSQTAPWTPDLQSEAFRELNALVRATNPNQENTNNPIVALINGWYPRGVNILGSTFTESYVPPGWTQQPGVYQNYVTPFCRGCHIASGDETLDFTRHADFRAKAFLIRQDVCRQHNMPHAEVPYRKAWTIAALPLVLDDPAVLPTPDTSIGDSKCVP